MEAQSDARSDLQQKQQADLSPLIRISCPSCRKNYSVALDQLHQMQKQQTHAASSNPSFKCVTCPARFSVVFPVDVVTQSAETVILDLRQTPPLRGPESVPSKVPSPRAAGEAAPLAQSSAHTPTQTRECPKCGARNARVAVECRSCGVVFARFKPEEEERVAVDIQLAGSLELVAFWKEVMDHYDDVEVHDKFVMACYEAGCLPFASQKYARLLAVTPEEEIAKAMRKRIVALASHKFEQQVRGGWKFRVPGFTGMAICLGAMVTILGLFMPHARNLTGIGVSMLALVLGVRFFLRGPN